MTVPEDKGPVGDIFKQIQLKTQEAKEKLQDGIRLFNTKSNVTDIVGAKPNIMALFLEAHALITTSSEISLVGLNNGIAVATKFAKAKAGGGMSDEGQKTLEEALKLDKKDNVTNKRKGEEEGADDGGGHSRPYSRRKRSGPSQVDHSNDFCFRCDTKGHWSTDAGLCAQHPLHYQYKNNRSHLGENYSNSNRFSTQHNPNNYNPNNYDNYNFNDHNNFNDHYNYNAPHNRPPY